MPTIDRPIETAWWTLRLGYGALAVAIGVDKFFHRLASWDMYLAAWVEALLPVSTSTFFAAVGAVEITVGVMVLTRWTRAGAYLLTAWLVGIAVQLVTAGMFYDLAVRDVGLALGAFALAQLTEGRSSRAVRSGA
ncbi:MAG TPA: hypothetical protein VI942_10785 [Thermoanaerobaculia bacterium]|nr:hypothetical protein [Thermoanaerobaculia bacterium]